MNSIKLEEIAENAHTIVGPESGEFNFDETWRTSVRLKPLMRDASPEQSAEVWERENKPLLTQLINDVVNRDPGTGPTILYQLPARGDVYDWQIRGICDILVLEPIESSDGFRSKVLEVKSSWSEKSSHQIQAAVYSLLLERIANELGYQVTEQAAIIHREQDLREIDFEDDGSIAMFDVDSRKTEVLRLLQPHGELESILEGKFDSVGYRLDRKCDGCEFNEICFTKAIESKDPALLGLTQGDRKRLEEHGIETLDEFAKLFEREADKRPYDYRGLTIADGNRETVRSLSEQGTLANRLPELVQRAQALAGNIDPTYEAFDFVEFLKGTGNGKLPEDSPRGNVNPSTPKKRLIRIYLYVQTDYIRDRICLLGARINGHHIEPHSIVQLTDEVPMGKEESDQAEEELLKEFLAKLFRNLREAAEETPSDGLAEDTAYYHLYVYTRNERNAFLEAIRRHPTIFGSEAVRDLLGLREGLDQSMVSVIQTEITDRLALQYPGTGIVQTVEQMITERWRVSQGYHDRTVWKNEEWQVEIDGEHLDLRRVFRVGLFERMKPYAEQGDSIEFLGNGGRSPDGFYPVKNRFGNQIPLEYIWGVLGELTSLLSEDESITELTSERPEDLTELGEDAERVRPYLFREGTDNRIQRADIEALSAKLCDALEHIERSIRFKNSFLGKQPLPVQLPSFELPETSLAESCKEYLTLEQATDEQNRLEYYMDMPIERVRTGESTIFRVVAMEEINTRFGTKYLIRGELLYDELFEHPDRVLDACKLHGGDGSSSGSWMVMTTLDAREDGNFEQIGVDRPSQIRQSPVATVASFDREAREVIVHADEDMKPYFRFQFLSWHRGLTTPAEYTEHEDPTRLSPIEVGSVCILDPYADSWPNQRAYDALDYVANNYLYSLLSEAYNHGRTGQFDVQFCDEDDVQQFLDICDDHLEISPAGKQREFIKHASEAISVLQGPPGTGKTSYALAPAVLSRLFGFEQAGKRLVAGITAPSHTAVDESLDSVHDRLVEYRQTDETIGLKNVLLYRVGGSGDNIPPGVTHVDYYEEKDVREVKSALQLAEQNQAHVILFATTTSMRGLVDRLVKYGYDEPDTAEEFMAAGGSIYDLLIVDEASMLDLPNTLLAGTFLRQGGQVMLIGDHRQMEPVQVHEWESEDRRTIEENLPFMSALNFVRFLRGDLSELAFTDKNSPCIGETIPMTGLDLTYRMHKIVADILTNLIYQDDAIELRSDQLETLPAINPTTPGVATAMDPDAPIVLIIHDEATSQDANLTEVAIIEGLMTALPEMDAGEIGVVTPHNAQKARLRDHVGDRATPNTVEKFQGGERDLIFVSATASDPDYVRAESKFLLNPNRLNVAMSRMKHKLVIIASESVFRMIPQKASEYDDAIVWKRLYQQMGVLDSPSSVEYSIEEFVPRGVEIPDVGKETKIQIYPMYASRDL